MVEPLRKGSRATRTQISRLRPGAGAATAGAELLPDVPWLYLHALTTGMSPSSDAKKRLLSTRWRLHRRQKRRHTAQYHDRASVAASGRCGIHAFAAQAGKLSYAKAGKGSAATRPRSVKDAGETGLVHVLTRAPRPQGPISGVGSTLMITEWRRLPPRREAG